MNNDGIYCKVTQEYYYLDKRRRELMHERDRIIAKLEMIDEILVDLNDILCKHGNHIYEHFEEKESQESEEET